MIHTFPCGFHVCRRIEYDKLRSNISTYAERVRIYVRVLLYCVFIRFWQVSFNGCVLLCLSSCIVFCSDIFALVFCYCCSRVLLFLHLCSVIFVLLFCCFCSRVLLFLRSCSVIFALVFYYFCVCVLWVFYRTSVNFFQNKCRHLYRTNVNFLQRKCVQNKCEFLTAQYRTNVFVTEQMWKF